MHVRHISLCFEFDRFGLRLMYGQNFKFMI